MAELVVNEKFSIVITRSYLVFYCRVHQFTEDLWFIPKRDGDSTSGWYYYHVGRETARPKGHEVAALLREWKTYW